jgi:hypothetical protein
MNVCKVWVGKPEGNRPQGRSGRTRKNNIRRDPLEIGWGGVDWIHLAPDRNQWVALVNMVMNPRAP